MHSIHIISGANSELAKPELERYKNDSSKTIIALFNNTKILKESNVIPLQVDLTNTQSTDKIKNAILDALNDNTTLITIQHFIGKFKYEPNESISYNNIDEEIFRSNTLTFINLINGLDQYIGNKKFKVKIQSIGSLSDDDPDNHNRPSFNLSKARIKDICALLSSRYNNVYSHMVSTSTVNTGNERKLRPNVSDRDFSFWLSIDEFRKLTRPNWENLDKSNNSIFLEQKVFKPHEEYEKFQNETKEIEEIRRNKEIGSNIK